MVLFQIVLMSPSKLKVQMLKLVVTSKLSISTLFKKPKISFLLRKIDFVDILTRINRKIVFTCFGIMWMVGITTIFGY